MRIKFEVPGGAKSVECDHGRYYESADGMVKEDGSERLRSARLKNSSFCTAEELKNPHLGPVFRMTEIHLYESAKFATGSVADRPCAWPYGDAIFKPPATSSGNSLSPAHTEPLDEKTSCSNHIRREGCESNFSETQKGRLARLGRLAVASCSAKVGPFIRGTMMGMKYSTHIFSDAEEVVRCCLKQADMASKDEKFKIRHSRSPDLSSMCEGLEGLEGNSVAGKIPRRKHICLFRQILD